MRREQTIEQVMRDCYPKLCMMLMSEVRISGKGILLDDVEDCIMEASILLYAQWDQRKDYNIFGWLYSTSLHILQNLYRVKCGRNQITAISLDDDQGGADEASAQIAQEMADQVRALGHTQALLDAVKEHVDEKTFQFLLDYYAKGANAKILSEQYHISEAAVWKRKERLIKKIRQMLFNALLTAALSGFALATTYVSEGAERDDGTLLHRPPCEPRVPGSDSASPLSKEDALTLLGFLNRLAPESLEELDMRLIDRCYRTIDDAYGQASDQGNVKLAVRNLRKRVAREKAQAWTERHASGRGSRRMVIVLAVLGGLLLLTTVAMALGWAPWQYDMSADNDNLYVNIVGDETMAGDPFPTFHPTGLDAEFDAWLEKYGINIPLPTWIPEGFVCRKVEHDCWTEDSSIQINFDCGNRSFYISVTKYLFGNQTFSESTYPRDTIVFEQPTRGGQKYTVYSNRAMMGTVWNAQPYVCQIIGSLTKEEVYKMIDSIYEGRAD
ncbi:MAG: DUF4367 domain-containing protein [Clostridia bacterium]